MTITIQIQSMRDNAIVSDTVRNYTSYTDACSYFNTMKDKAIKMRRTNRVETTGMMTNADGCIKSFIA